jgi:hypothetical protein
MQHAQIVIERQTGKSEEEWPLHGAKSVRIDSNSVRLNCTSGWKLVHDSSSNTPDTADKGGKNNSPVHAQSMSDFAGVTLFSSQAGGP